MKPLFCQPRVMSGKFILAIGKYIYCFNQFNFLQAPLDEVELMVGT